MATATQSFVIKKNSGGNFTPMSEGLHQAVVAEVKDLGILQGKFGAQHKFVARFVNAEGAEASRFYTPSIHEKSNLYKDWNSIIDLTGDAFDIYSLEGQQCQVLAVERKTDKGVAADVSKILKPVKGQKVPYTKKTGTTAKAAQAASDAKALAGTEITDSDLDFLG